MARPTLVTSFPPNTELTATGRTTDGRWWRIALGNGQVGFMHTSVISEQPVQTAAAPQSQPQSQPQQAADPNAIVMIDGGGQPTQSNNPNVGVSPQQAQQLVETAQNPSSMGTQVLGGLISGLSQLASGNGQQIPTPSSDARMTFAAYNHPITVRARAVVLGAPGNGQPIAQISKQTQMTASARDQRRRLVPGRAAQREYRLLVGQLDPALGPARRGRSGEQTCAAIYRSSAAGDCGWPA